MTKYLSLITAVALAFGLTACVSDADVREACRDHNGVRSAEGSSTRMHVTCADGFYLTVRDD